MQVNLNTPPSTVYLTDYQPPAFIIDSVDLHFELNESDTKVHSILKIQRNSQLSTKTPLILDGDNLELISISYNGKELNSSQYEKTSTQLILPNIEDNFTLEIITQIFPQKNTALSGLYRSNGLFCTQCEPHGFRRITYYLDRPDVMSRFTTTIVADKTDYPVLLSNGNKIGQDELTNNRHWIKWEDPFKKPSYLFALVAGKLAKISDTYKKMSGNVCNLEIYCEPGNEDKCLHAMTALKNSMQWDEENYGREYDLDIYMIVVVHDFNMGAMENKGLNIFNSKYVLAKPETATDIDFQLVEAVIGHEYFHNWTGNRITCRDWFQLSLKEGLTVFREQQFSAAMGSSAVKRIQDVKVMRTRQFAEDAGPMAHPVRPASYMEINNFYTATVYNKGSEVIRMMHTILGEKGFRKGMDLYFERHDGQAVTIEDFVASMSDANKTDLTQFFNWYNQAGTPVVSVEANFDPQAKKYSLHMSQYCPPTPEKAVKEPFLIPIKVELLSSNGKIIPIKSNLLLLKDREQTFVFDNIAEQPIPSLLGNFSAPVKLEYAYSDLELLHLMMYDPDLFNRWDATQRIGVIAIKQLMKLFQQNEPLVVPKNIIESFDYLLEQNIDDPEYMAQLFILPSFQYVGQTLSAIPADALNAARHFLMLTLSNTLFEKFKRVYINCQQHDKNGLDRESIGYRALKNICLGYLAYGNNPAGLALAKEQYYHSTMMTDLIGAMAAINHTFDTVRDEIFEDFYARWKREPLVVNKWLSLQASSQLPTVLSKIKSLMNHEGFDLGNPNKVYSLVGTFGGANPERFHDDNGAGYQFIADTALALNDRNPQVAAHVINALTQWKRLEEPQRELMRNALLKVQVYPQLCKDVNEIVTKSLQEK